MSCNLYTSRIINAITNKPMTKQQIVIEDKLFFDSIVKPNLEKINNLFKEAKNVV